MKSPLILLTVVFTTFSHAADIVWISDQLPILSGATDHDGGATGIFGPGAGPYPDEGIISLLTSAGHAVTRFNPSNTAALTLGEVSTLNGFDLLIIGRSIASASFDSAAETLPWNTQITVPLMVTNTYISRSSRLGWFSGGPTQPDVVSNTLTFANPSNPVSQYLIDGISMSGSTTTNPMTEAITYANSEVDARGISLITDPIIPGGTLIASAPTANSTFIASWPVGTTLVGTSVGQVLAGYRMQFLIGNRESGTAPNNVIGNAGFENMTTEGEGLFLRAVAVAANNGLVPIPEPGVAALLALASVGLLARRR